MNHTTNLHLPQWEETDRIHHDDFNDAFSKIDANCGNCRIETGSYTGNGQYGTNKPVSLSFSFSPKLVLVMANDANFTINEDVANYTIFLRGVTSFRGCRASNETNSAGYTVQWGDKTLSWRASNSSCCPEGQLNVSGTTYHYIAIG